MRQLIDVAVMFVFLGLFAQNSFSAENVLVFPDSASGFLELHGSSVDVYPGSFAVGVRGSDSVFGSTQSNSGPNSFTQNFAVDGFVEELSAGIGFSGCQLGGMIWIDFSGSASCKSNTLICGGGASQCAVVSCRPGSGYLNGSASITASASKDFGAYSVGVCTDNAFSPSNGIQLKTVKGESRAFVKFDVSFLNPESVQSAELSVFVESINSGNKSLALISDFGSLDSGDWSLAKTDLNSAFIPDNFSGGWVSSDVTEQLKQALSGSGVLSFLVFGQGSRISLNSTDKKAFLSVKVNSLPEAGILSPSGQLDSVSSFNGSDLIVFEYRDADEFQELTADLGYHLSGELPFSNVIALDLNLAEICWNSDNNIASFQKCFFDWNSFPLNDRNVFIDLRVKDPFDFVEISGNEFKVDNAAPEIAGIEIDSFNGTGFTNNVAPEVVVLFSDVSDYFIRMRFSCNKEVFTDWNLFEGPHAFNLVDVNAGCSAEDGNRAVFVELIDPFSLTSSAFSEIVLDRISPIPSSLDELPFFNPADFVSLKWIKGGDESGLFSQKVFRKEKLGEWFKVQELGIAQEAFSDANVSDGNYSYFIQSVDNAGNFSNSNVVSTIVDFTAPELVFVYPDENVSVNFVGFVLRDVSGIDLNSISVDLNYSLIDFNSWQSCAVVLFSNDLNCGFFAEEMLEGLNQLKLEFKDNRGLLGSGKSPDFYFDKLPEIESEQLDKNAFNSGVISFTVIDSWPGGINLDSIKVFKNSELIGFNALNGCSVIENGFLCSVDLNVLSQEFYLISIEAESVIGQKGFRDFNALFDVNAPFIEITAPANGFTSTNQNVLLEYSGFDLESGIDFFEVKSDDGNWINNGLDLSRAFSLPVGVHLLSARIFDKAGNFFEAGVSVTVQAVEEPVDNGSPALGQNSGTPSFSGGGSAPARKPPVLEPVLEPEVVEEFLPVDENKVVGPEPVIEVVELGKEAEVEEPVKGTGLFSLNAFSLLFLLPVLLAFGLFASYKKKKEKEIEGAEVK